MLIDLLKLTVSFSAIMNNSKVYISLFSMVADKKGYIRLFFKVLLLAVYSAFFIVQLFLRYSPHTLQSLEVNNYKKVVASKDVSHYATISAKDSKKSKNLSYLNKRFHPQDAVNFRLSDFQIQAVFAEIKKKFYTTDKYFASLTIRTSSLRGPPVFA
ncbi:MAG: hypothetical protein JST87_15715 [Bacteroidetes bacterium]|nr:hypothetical protein [Bacteroidota bacterium]MBS1934944.1 hypothetical protein [Bacteroidota bacterium]